MSRLINRQTQIPQGLTFYQPETKWMPPRYASFDTIVNGLISHRNANPHLRDQHHWSVDYNTVADEVDAFNARLCEVHGWTKYISSEGPMPPAAPLVPPKPMPPPTKSLLESVRTVVAGAIVLVDWLVNGAEAVAPEESNRRAEICAGCPKNEGGDWTRFFTVPVSQAIQGALNSRKDMGLSTFHDEKLGVCSACNCPLKLKVHLPLDKIKAKIDPADMQALDPRCWITK